MCLVGGAWQLYATCISQHKGRRNGIINQVSGPTPRGVGLSAPRRWGRGATQGNNPSHGSTTARPAFAPQPVPLRMYVLLPMPSMLACLM